MYKIVLTKERDQLALLTKAGSWVRIPFTANGMEVLRQIMLGDAIARDRASRERGVGTISAPPQDAVNHMLKALAGCDVPVTRLGPFSGKAKKAPAPDDLSINNLVPSSFWDELFEQTKT